MACARLGMAPLKALLFCFFGGVASLMPFLPLHLRAAGLSAAEARVVSMVAPAVSLLGPLAVGPFADRLASGLWGHSASDGGLKDYAGRMRGHRRLRSLLAALVVLSAVAYCLLLLVVPVVTRRDATTPGVTFRCNGDLGGVIVQERCADQCHEWAGGQRVGSLVLTDCRYDCEEEAELHEAALFEGEETTTAAVDEDDGGTTARLPFVNPVEASMDDEEEEVTTATPTAAPTTVEVMTMPAPPSAVGRHGSPTHLCFSETDVGAVCHAFYEPTNSLPINATLEGSQVGSDAGLCVYPLSSFSLKGRVYSHLSCRPSAMARCRVVCSVDDPYQEAGLLGAGGSCPSLLGDPRLTFWSYVLVRSVADCFPPATLALISATLLLPSPHPPGQHVAWGAIGAALVAPLSAATLVLTLPLDPHLNFLPHPWPSFALHALLALLAAVLLLVFQLPVLLGEGHEARGGGGGKKKAAAMASESPVPYARTKPRPRLGPYPPSHASAHACEAAALFLVLSLLGMLWGALDAYMPWYLSDLMSVSGEAVEDARNASVVLNETLADWSGWLPPPASPSALLLLLGLLMTAAALPAVPLLWHIEKIIEICGHANLLIIAFTLYIVRYAVLSFIDDGWWALISEAVATPTCVALAWATASHYSHLLFPPRWTVTAQAAAIVAHFCVGRCLGSVIGGCMWGEVGAKAFLQGGALVSAVVATVYFLVYHCCLKARCIGGGGLKPQPPVGSGVGDGRGHDAAPEGPTTNGNYTPLRVYHNGRGEARKDRY